MFGLLLGGGLGKIIGGVFTFLASPLGIAAMIALAYFGGHWFGEREGNRNCEARIEQSRRDATQIDTGLEAEALKRMAAENARLQDIALAAQQEANSHERAIGEMAEDLRACRLPTDDDWRRLQ